MSLGRRPSIVLLGMMTKMPVAGVVWETVQYLVGFRRLGFDVYYVEAHGRTPTMLMRAPDDDSTALAAAFIERALAPFDFGGSWAFHALHADGAVYGLSEAALARAYRDADAIVNLYGGTMPRPEHSDPGRLIFLETDPCEIQIQLHDGDRTAIDYLEPHVAFFTWAENYGRPDCRLPVTDRFDFKPTRMPIVPEFWLGGADDSGRYTTIGNWRQPWREIWFEGERYTWSKDEEFLKVIDLPGRTDVELELALASYEPADQELLETHGWRVRPAAEISADVDLYRDYVVRSRGELTVAKDQNVRLRSGWFSDRGAAYLAAGRPVVTQDTGFGCALPTGEALFAFATAADAVAAFERIEADYPRARRAAFALAREHFDAERVLGRMLEEAGVALPRRVRTAVVAPIDPELDLTVVSRRPTTLRPETVEAVLARPLPAAWSLRRPGVSIVCVAHDGLVFTRLCVESVLLNSGDGFELIVVDNASSDGTAGYLAAVAVADDRVRVIRNEENRGFAAGVNQGLREAVGDALVILNNDVIVPPGWLDRLLPHLDDETVGLVGPTTNRCGNEAEVDVDYRTHGELVRFALTRADECGNSASAIPVSVLFSSGMTRATFERVGELDEGFGAGLFEDDDLSERMRQAGLRVACGENAFVHHFAEGSLGALFTSGKHGELFAANRARYEQKWGISWEPHERRSRAWYRDLVAQIKGAADRELPPDAVVLVVSNGDPDLLELGAQRVGWHFPQTEDGTYAGYHPADSAEAIAHLRSLHDKGATHILFPQTNFWWLKFYDCFRKRLADGYDEVARVDEVCVICPLETSGRGLATEEKGATRRKEPR